jgi:hypothetical protein
MIMGRDNTCCELEGILLCWYLDVQASCIPVEGSIFCEKAKQVDYFAASYYDT